jgi:hypothetical protein
MALAYKVLTLWGPLTLLAGIVGTLCIYFVYRSVQEPRLRPFFRYAALSTGACVGGYWLGMAIGIAIACMPENAGNLCGLIGVFGVGPLVAGVATFAYACYWASQARSGA